MSLNAFSTPLLGSSTSGSLVVAKTECHLAFKYPASQFGRLNVEVVVTESGYS
jgi:hypothetical protein